MATVIRGPAWSSKGLDQTDSRYPLRVERHLGRLVDGLLPGVITTTTHARAYALHTLVWAEAAARDLDEPTANDLLRRCEVVLAGVTLQHAEHGVWIPGPHGGDQIRKGIEQTGWLDIGELAARYTPNTMGFGGVYLGSELRLLEGIEETDEEVRVFVAPGGPPMGHAVRDLEPIYPFPTIDEELERLRLDYLAVGGSETVFNAWRQGASYDSHTTEARAEIRRRRGA